MIIVRIVQFVKIVQLVQLDYYGYIKFFGVFVGTWVGAFTMLHAIFSMDNTEKILKYFFQLAIHITPDVKVPILSYPAEKWQLRPFPAFRRGWARAKPENEPFSLALFFHNLFDTTLSII